MTASEDTHMDIAPQHAAPEPDLLRDMVMEILSRVPAKPVTRLKLVCKSWNSIISDPGFVKLHLQRSPKNTILLFTRTPVPTRDRETRGVTLSSVESFIQNPSLILGAQGDRRSLFIQEWVRGSCNGLICVIFEVNYASINTSEFWFRLWNPLTGIISEYSPFLCVHERTSFGFGYDESSGRYKVVAVSLIANYKNSRETSVKVYSSGGSSWRNMGSFPAFPRNFRKDGVYIGGTLNWLAVTADKLVIVSLDLKSETYKQILLPNGFYTCPNGNKTLQVCGNCLYLFHEYKEIRIKAWQMKEFGDETSWTRLLNINIQHLPYELKSLHLYIRENGDIFLLVNNILVGVSTISLRDRAGNTVGHVILCGANLKRTYDYVESLVQPC